MSRSGPTVAYPMGRPMVSAGDEVFASLLAGYATAGDIGLYRQAGCSPSATEGSPPSVAHGHDIDNFLSIGRPQAPSDGCSDQVSHLARLAGEGGVGLTRHRP